MGLRRRRRGTHEAENLTRFRADVASFTRLPGGATEGPDSPVAPPDGSQKVRPQYTMTRKERRKEARKLGKMRKNAFLQKKPVSDAKVVMEVVSRSPTKKGAFVLDVRTPIITQLGARVRP